MSDRERSMAPEPLRRSLGSPVLFAVVQGFVAAAAYFSLGLAAERVHGWIWLVYLAAAVFFVLTVLSYVEGASLHQERGGATVIARFAFNELWSFVAGWAILLDYLILVALTAFIAEEYLAAFWEPLHEGWLEVVVTSAIIGILAWLNIRGFDARRFERITLNVLVDVAVQIVLVVVGLALLFQPEVLTDPGSVGGAVGTEDVLFAFTLAIVGFTGLDASSGFAGQVAVGRQGLRRLVTVRSIAVLIPYVGLTVVAASALGAPGGLLTSERDVEAPVLGLVRAFEPEWLRDTLTYVVAASAASVLITACATALLGMSRLGYSLALNRQIPSGAGRLHPTFKTPVVLIVLGAVFAIALAAPADIEFLAGLYAFGATIAFALVHLSVIVLRRREPDRDRPYRMPFNVRLGGVSYPVPAVLGAVASVASLAAVMAVHGHARILGPVWMALGVTLYVAYRRSQGKDVFRRVTVPESTLSRTEEVEAQYGSILVPVMGTPLDDDIMQTAGRLAAEERPDEEEEGAVIEAMWPFVIPMALPLDARLPEADLKEARAALKRAKAVGQEYMGVEVSTFTVRARSAGEAIVREARRRGVEVIVMPAEEPTRLGGGLRLGGRQGLRDTFIGETTRYVINKAHCRVILTAPPSEATLRLATERALARAGEPPPSPDPTRPRARMRRRPLQTPDDPDR